MKMQQLQGIWLTGCLMALSVSVFASDRAMQTSRPPAPPEAVRIGKVIFAPPDLMRHVEYLAHPDLEGRRGRGATLAADYIVRHLREAGLEPLFNGSFEQPIPSGGAAESPAILGRNVGALLRGSDPQLQNEVILLGVHYDHLGIRQGQVYPGADDNATSVAMLLETAKFISQLRPAPKRSIALVGFDLEEQLLWGSRWFASHPPVPLERIKLMVTSDLIGRSLGDLPLPLVFMFGSEYCPELRSHIAQVGIPPGLELGRLGTDFIGTRSDYGPFRDQRIPFLFFSTGEHPDYHTPRDIPGKIDAVKLSRISSLIAQMIVEVANSPTTPRWNSRPTPDLAEAATMEQVTRVLLAEEAAGRRTLSAPVRFVAEQTRSKTRYVRERGTLSEDERTWLRRSAQYLLLSAF
jgi:hypothetical protein